MRCMFRPINRPFLYLLIGATKFRFGAGKVPLNCASADMQQAGDFLAGQFFEIAQHEQLAIIDTHTMQRLPHLLTLPSLLE